MFHLSGYIPQIGEIVLYLGWLQPKPARTGLESFFLKMALTRYFGEFRDSFVNVRHILSMTTNSASAR